MFPFTLTHDIYARKGRKGIRPGSLAAPRNVREMLLALRNYESDRGIDDFLAGFDFADVSPHQVYYSSLGRLPESAGVAAQPDGYDARQHLKAAMLSAEFQSTLIARVLRAFPEKKRLLFVHVPKCAGSDLAAHLMAKFPYLAQVNEQPVHFSPEKLLSRLKELAMDLMRRDEIVAMGHIGLDWFLNQGLIRFGDMVFSVVRPPLEMAISKLNFVLTLHAVDPAIQSPQTLEWLKSFDMDKIPRDLSKAELKQQALKLLFDSRIVPGNNICRFLGRGNLESTIDLCASADIELTTVSRYRNWLLQRWGINSTSRINESNKFLTIEDLGSSELEYLRDYNREDQIFYERVDHGLNIGNKLSLRGAEI